jgi:hypothetical protein
MKALQLLLNQEDGELLDRACRLYGKGEIEVAGIILSAALRREFCQVGKQPVAKKPGHRVGRPIKHGRYSQASGSDGKNPVPKIGK